MLKYPKIIPGHPISRADRLSTMLEIACKCPACAATATLRVCDTLGACGGDVFCPACGCEYDPSTGLQHDERLCNECKAFARAISRAPYNAVLYFGADNILKSLTDYTGSSR